MENSESKNNNQENIIDPNILSILKSICKLKIETSLETKLITAYLLEFYVDQHLFHCLISNGYEITNNIALNISYDNDLKSTNINIKFAENKRYFKNFKNVELDITVVEILDIDNIPKDYYLYPESEIIINSELINKQIYIPYYSQEKELKMFKGKIKEINKNEFIYSSNEQNGLSGNHVFLENCFDVLGIQKRFNQDHDKTEYCANFIYREINIIKDDIRKKINKGKYINEKYIWEDGKYYLGEFKNHLPNGKGIKYYSNGNINYEGDFINGIFEGEGKYIYDDSDYFIGQYKNSLRNGKGILYYKNGNIMNNCEYANGKAEGYGKYIYENGKYYIGQWKTGLCHGKGILYYPNGNIMYEGDFINNKRGGNGKYIWEDGSYYIGQWKTGYCHGKGRLYYHNGNIKYQGDYVNEKYERIGKYIWEDGKYYMEKWFKK